MKRVLFIINFVVIVFSARCQDDFYSLIKAPAYVVRVKILSKPGRIEWLGVHCSVWAKVLEDYRRNFPAMKQDSIAIFVNGSCIEGVRFDSAGVEMHAEYILLLTGTSLLHGRGNYWRTLGVNAIGKRVGTRNRDGFIFADKFIAWNDLMDAVRKSKHIEKINDRHYKIISRHRPDSAYAYGGDRLWSGKYSDGVYADGVYVLSWQSASWEQREISLYRNGITKVLANIDDSDVLRKVTKFLKRQNCNEEERNKCLEAVRKVLTKKRVRVGNEGP